MARQPANPYEGINRGRHYRNSRRARESRQDLIDLLGGKCAECRSDGDGEPLHIDHEDGRNWEPSKVSSHRRVARYWKEYRAGVRLRVLCDECNGWDGLRRMKPREQERRRRKRKGDRAA